MIRCSLRGYHWGFPYLALRDFLHEDKLQIVGLNDRLPVRLSGLAGFLLPGDGQGQVQIIYRQALA